MAESPVSFPPLVCAFPRPASNVPRNATHVGYIHEVLAYAGLETMPVEPDALADRLADSRILLTIGEGPLPDTLDAWVAAGGIWISIAGICGKQSLLGVRSLAPDFVLWGGSARNLGEGWIESIGESAISASLPIPLHHFGGVAAEIVDAQPLARCLDAHGGPTETAGIVWKRIGDGAVMLIASDVTGSIARIQMGRPVFQDGVPAPDGTAPVGDGVLKSDDGIVLDWIRDRQDVPGAPGLRGFLLPQADLGRELVLRTLFWAGEFTRSPIRLLWYWPDAIPAVGHLSHDSDGNDLERAGELLDALDRAQAPGTWCVILPGYPPEMIGRIVAAGHELATHYDAMTDGTVFSEREFDAQWSRLCVQFGSTPVTNKNHYLRWEGDVDILRWCMARGIRMDQSKGASKTGACGFGFGASHPYRPIDSKGRVLDILELPTPTQDLHVFAPEALADPLLDGALRVHGVAHFLFHPAHMAREHVADSLVRTVEKGRALGMHWWTGARMVAWNDARRSARWQDGKLVAGALLKGATLLTYAPWASSPENNTQIRWGIKFHQEICDIDAGGVWTGNKP